MRQWAAVPLGLYLRVWSLWQPSRQWLVEGNLSKNWMNKLSTFHTEAYGVMFDILKNRASYNAYSVIGTLGGPLVFNGSAANTLHAQHYYVNVTRDLTGPDLKPTEFRVSLYEMQSARCNNYPTYPASKQEPVEDLIAAGFYQHI